MAKQEEVYSLFIGRWQPFHAGHKKLIDTVLAEGKNVCIAMRDTKMNKENPYTTKERKKFIRLVFPDKDRVKIITIPDITEVVYGRGVGYGIREIKMPADVEAISATKIRAEKNDR